ncbi:MAG: hypothetical protein ACI8R4_000003 [Paracoccaceae bacterium]|jgi:hypothetical protein
MKYLSAPLLAALLAVAPMVAWAQDLIDKGFVAGWNVMVDPQMGNGCLIQNIFEDLSVVRIGYDAENNRGYFVVFNMAWGQIEKGKTYDITFDLDGQSFDAKAIGFYLGKVPGAGVFFDDRSFVEAIAKRQVMTVFGQAGAKVMAIDLKGSGKAIEYARKCQAASGS